MSLRTLFGCKCTVPNVLCVRYIAREASVRRTMIVVALIVTILSLIHVSRYLRSQDLNCSSVSLIQWIFELDTCSPVTPTKPSIDDSKVSSTTNLRNSSSTVRGLPQCPVIPPGLVGRLKMDLKPRTWNYLELKFARSLYNGGRWKPANCIARHRVAIVIPYRDREEHLKVFLNHMHPFLQKQQLDYGIYVVEPAPEIRFNRAMLMNIGYAESLKIYDYQCFVFHDVDLYPEDDRNIYSCPDHPRHMSVAINKFNYKLPYAAIFGGVCALKKEHMIQVNGFSNRFFGWGGEDDDMHNRIAGRGLKIIRYPNEIARYTMMSHGREKKNLANPDRNRLINTGKSRWDVEGINSLLYNRTSLEFKPLFTHIKVSMNINDVLKYDTNSIKKLKIT